VTTGSAIRVALPVRAPFDSSSLLRFLGDRAIPGVELVDGSTFRRSVVTAHGPAIVALEAQRDHVRLDIELKDVRAMAPVVRTATSLFDVDVDPSLVARTLGSDPALRPLVEAHPGIRLPGAADGFELAVRAIVGQQVSVAAARTMLGRIAARFGAALGGPVPLTFPIAAALADAPLEELGIIGRRASAIRGVATAVESGDLDLSGSGDPDETVGRLLELDGVGPWTAEYIRMRALRDPDAFVWSDLGVRRAVERLGLDPSRRAILARAEAWRPWRAYATMLLWRSES
jgi:AraC family transcriptional regulator of adaptative response / DNA-3-methyladenine glycosylase II